MTPADTMAKLATAVQKVRDPIAQEETMSGETPYWSAMMVKPGCIITGILVYDGVY
jgi:hypothetical protein